MKNNPRQSMHSSEESFEDEEMFGDVNVIAGTGLRHDTVLLAEAVDFLEIAPDDVVVDGTLGAAGHFRRLKEILGSSGVLVGIDADNDSLIRAQSVLDEETNEGPRVHLVHDNFRNLHTILDTLSISCIDKALFDLGWNGFQLASGRGFSFRVDEPLLMTYGDPHTASEEGKTAADLVNSLPEEELADLIYQYGEEPPYW